VERIHAARTDGTDAMVINPGAFTHYSYALHDALQLLTVPKAEVHLTHTLGREAFRRHSAITPVVDITLTGLGALGYRIAVRAVLRLAIERR
jgi:3-dehydroquinate dehydratase II